MNLNSPIRDDISRTNDKEAFIVVGGGLAGLSLALGISSLDPTFQVHLCEIRSSFSPTAGSTFALAPPGVLALDEICPKALSDIQSKGILFGGQKNRQCYMLPWWVVRDALLDQAQKRKDQIHIWMGVELQTITDEETSKIVSAVFKKENGSEFTIQGRLLVGCDGVHSQVRNLLHLPPAVKTNTKWRGSISVPFDSPKLGALLPKKDVVSMGMKIGPCSVNLFNFHSAIPNAMSWTITADRVGIPEGTNVWDVLEPYMENEEDKLLVKEIMDLSKPDDLCRALQFSTIDPEKSTLACGWGGKGRVTLAGDAAHCTRPTSGLGGSMAFEDSVVLCREIAKTHSNDDMALVVARYETARMPRVSRVWKDQWDRSEAYLKGGKSLEFSNDFLKWLDAGV